MPDASAPASRFRGLVKPLIVYTLMLAGAVGVFLLVREAGIGLTAPDPAPEAPRFGANAATSQASNLARLLIALVVMVAVARGAGRLFRLVGQPPVIGEVIAGILLGPSLLGALWPEATEFVLTPNVQQRLRAISSIGVMLYMFLVGLELNPRVRGKRAHATVMISHASIVAPFVLGSALALLIYPRFSTSDVPFPVFALFMGAAMSVTAFPVLARILTDQGLQRTPLGIMALTCAAVDDVTAWCLLAFAAGVARASAGHALTTAGLTAVFLLVMAFLARPLLRRISARADAAGELTQGTTAIVFTALLLAALATEAIGIHAIFGAFLVGALIPHHGVIAREMTRRLTDLVVVLMLPAFFVLTGMQTRLGLVNGWEEWTVCGLVILVAVAGKFGGTAVAAKATGSDWREAASLGALMNTRGLMQLIVLSVGLELRVLTPTLFAMMVIMAVVTTMMTAPALRMLTPRNKGGAPSERAEGSAGVVGPVGVGPQP